MAAPTKATLIDYLHDALPSAEAAAIEQRLRDDPATRALFDEVREEAERGDHTVGAIWRRSQVSCPTRGELGNYLLNSLDDDLLEYIRFHLETVGCAFCAAVLDDQRQKLAEPAEHGRARQRRILDSSAGVLRRLGRKA